MTLRTSRSRKGGIPMAGFTFPLTLPSAWESIRSAQFWSGADRKVRGRLFVGRPDGYTWVDMTDHLASARINLGDVANIGTGSSGVDVVVRQCELTLMNSRPDVDSLHPRDRGSRWNYSTFPAPSNPTNLLPENVSSVETDLTGFNKFAGTETITQDTTTAKFGRACLKLQTPGNAGNEGFFIGPFTASPGTEYTVSFYGLGAGNFRAVFSDQGGYTIGDILDFSLAGGWERFSITAPTAADDTGVRLYVYTNGVQALTARFDGFQVEEGPLGPWVPGGYLRNAYAPLLWPNREVVLEVAVCPINREPHDNDWIRVFRGYMGDSIQGNSDTGRITVACRDQSKRLQDYYIDTVRSYGSEAGVPAETVIQQILNDNLGAGVVTVYCPVSPGFMITPYQVEYQTVWDAIQQVATQIGWFLGYRWWPDINDFRLTFMPPPRKKSELQYDFMLEWTKDLRVQGLDITDRNVRNAIKVTYRDAATGQRATVTLQDADSIAEYGRRAMQIEEADTSLIDTVAEATALGNAALWDLKDLAATSRLTLPLLPTMDLFDGVVVTNPRLSSTQDFYAVQTVEHRMDWSDPGGRFQGYTEAVCSGRVIGTHGKWLRMQTRPGAKKPVGSGEIAPGAVGTDTVALAAMGSDKLHPAFWDEVIPLLFMIAKGYIIPDSVQPLLYDSFDASRESSGFYWTAIAGATFLAGGGWTLPASGGGVMTQWPGYSFDTFGAMNMGRALTVPVLDIHMVTSGVLDPANTMISVAFQVGRNPNTWQTVTVPLRAAPADYAYKGSVAPPAGAGNRWVCRVPAPAATLVDDGVNRSWSLKIVNNGTNGIVLKQIAAVWNAVGQTLY
jgi:hypothetical protein